MAGTAGRFGPRQCVSAKGMGRRPPIASLWTASSDEREKQRCSRRRSSTLYLAVMICHYWQGVFHLRRQRRREDRLSRAPQATGCQRCFRANAACVFGMEACAQFVSRTLRALTHGPRIIPAIHPRARRAVARSTFGPAAPAPPVRHAAAQLSKSPRLRPARVRSLGFRLMIRGRSLITLE